MNKTFLIIRREYLTRVQKKSFILMTILTPLIFIGIYILAIYLTMSPVDEKTILVIDKSGYLAGKFQNTESIKFDYSQTGDEDEAKTKVRDGVYSGTLIIPELNLEKPEGITLFSKDAMGMSVENAMERVIENEIESIKLKKSGIDKDILDSIKTNVNIHALNLGSGGEEQETNSALASGIGVFSGLLIYIFLFVYGTQVMRGVIEEKTSKIVEIIISSVRPIQLMLGKILGIAAVGLSQFLIWFILTIILYSGVTSMFLSTEEGQEKFKAFSEKSQQTEQVDTQADQARMAAEIQEVISKTNIPKILSLLIFYFLGGYLFYAAFFAMIGSAVDSEADSQQFIFPVILPIIFAFIMYGAVINDPNGSTAFWLSIIPFTSPIIMMVRVPFGVPGWELLLSMILMIAGFIFTTWMAGRVYRVGILMHGTKVNYKTLARWFMMKN